MTSISRATKKPDFCPVLSWLDETYVNGTFYSSHYDPNFNIEDVRSLLDESKEEQDV